MKAWLRAHWREIGLVVALKVHLILGEALRRHGDAVDVVLTQGQDCSTIGGAILSIFTGGCR